MLGTQLLDRHRWDWTEGAFVRWLSHPAVLCQTDRMHGLCELFRLAIPWQREVATGRNASAQREAMQPLIEAMNLYGAEIELPLFRVVVFERGFIEEVEVDELMMLWFAPALRDLGMIRRLVIEYDESDFEGGVEVVRQLIACMDRPKLQVLDLSTEITDLSAIESLSAWPGMSKMISLRCWTSLDGDLVAHTLARSPYLRNLRSLTLEVDGYGDLAMNAVLRSPHLTNLKQFMLADNDAADCPVSEETMARYHARFGHHQPHE